MKLDVVTFLFISIICSKASDTTFIIFLILTLRNSNIFIFVCFVLFSCFQWFYLWSFSPKKREPPPDCWNKIYISEWTIPLNPFQVYIYDDIMKQYLKKGNLICLRSLSTFFFLLMISLFSRYLYTSNPYTI